MTTKGGKDWTMKKVLAPQFVSVVARREISRSILAFPATSRTRAIAILNEGRSVMVAGRAGMIVIWRTEKRGPYCVEIRSKVIRSELCQSIRQVSAWLKKTWPKIKFNRAAACQ